MTSRTTMVLAASALFALLGPISAQAAELDVGPGGIHVDHPHHGRDCRTVIEHHRNAAGDDVTVRRQVCD